MSGIHWLPASGDQTAFPPAEKALREPDGLLAAGGDLHPRRLLSAYVRGIFPWYDEGQPILWWSPDPRAVLWPEDLRISRRLARTLRKTDLRFTADSAFGAVIEGCAAPRKNSSGTWITRDMAAAYQRLHAMGWAHSFEGWLGDDLAAGLYGIAIGRVFFAESMFTRVDNASKAVLHDAIKYLRARSFKLIDCQVQSEHLRSLGATTLPRRKFLGQLQRLCSPPGKPANWRRDHKRDVPPPGTDRHCRNIDARGAILRHAVPERPADSESRPPGPEAE